MTAGIGRRLVQQWWGINGKAGCISVGTAGWLTSQQPHGCQLADFTATRRCPGWHQRCNTAGWQSALQRGCLLSRRIPAHSCPPLQANVGLPSTVPSACYSTKPHSSQLPDIINRNVAPTTSDLALQHTAGRAPGQCTACHLLWLCGGRFRVTSTARVWCLTDPTTAIAMRQQQS